MEQRSILTRMAALTAAALIIVVAFAGCNLFGPPAIYDTADVSVIVDTGPSGAQSRGGASGPSFLIAGTTSPAEIDMISLSVVGEDKYGVFQDPLASVNMTGSGGSWSATVDDLPLGPALTFSIQAFDVLGTLIYTGTTTTVLGAGNLAVAIVLIPYDDGATQIFFPVIRQITRPAEIIQGTNAQVSVDLEGSSTETLTVDVTSGGGSFAPSNPIAVPLSSGGATLDLTYGAPAAAPGTYVHTVRAENEQGNSVSRDFSTVVVWETASGVVTIGGVAPAVTGFALSLSGSDLVLEATVTDDGPPTDMSYAWSFDGGLTFTNSTVNPAALSGYTEAATGTVTLTVTDSDTAIQAGGLSTTVTFVLPAGLFPDVVVTEPQSYPELQGVYASGDGLIGSTNEAQLWSEGVSETLVTASGGGTYSLFVDGGDVHAVGVAYDGSWGTPSYWINGQPVSFPITAAGGELHGIHVSGGDTHIVGVLRSGIVGVGAYWLNGAETLLSDGTQDTYVQGLRVVGSDVYVSGFAFNTSNTTVVRYWRNGVETLITDGTTRSQVSGIDVDGTDVYITGTEYLGGVWTATYWRNQTRVPLGAAGGNSFSYEVTIESGDVHVVGVQYGGSGTEARHWVNGVSQQLGTPGNEGGSFAYALAVDGSDVYIGGYRDSPLGRIATIWKNGTEIPLIGPQTQSRIYELFVSP
jgi:hypothetical protein